MVCKTWQHMKIYTCFADRMNSTGLLVVSNIKQIGNALQQIGKYVKTLFIHLNIVNANLQLKPAPIWSKLISQLYLDCSKQTDCGQLNINVLVSPLKGHAITNVRPIEILYSDSHCPDLCESLRKELNIAHEAVYIQQKDGAESSIMETVNDSNNEVHVTGPTALKMYDTVVLGGTFDRIHLGHKIFLTHAVLRACRRLVVGVTTSQMIRSKTLWELILPVDRRIEDVRNFLKQIDCSLQYEVVPIDDPFGPTRTDPNMDMLIVSEETLRGGHKVNELRAKNNLQKLEIFSIGLIENSETIGPKECKISSSNTRIDLLGTRLRWPEPRPHLPNFPYIIGLTGGIATGKSQMSQRFHDMGAVIMNCDQIGHEIYEPGQVCYDKVVQHFGEGRILDANTKKIDRKKLGAIVFANKEDLTKLNEIVWPELIVEVKRRINAIIANGVNNQKTVVIIEAAVLLQAGWETECHEVWSMIVPPEIALQRVMTRNSLSEEEARKRMSSQLSNSEIVAKSNVVFSSQWTPDFTKNQGEKAWRMLQSELNSPKASHLTNSML